MSNKIFEYLENIKGEPTAHLSGLKKVFLKNSDTESQLTQFAFGDFAPGETCPRHEHSTMYECFYFIKGTGKYIVDTETVEIRPGTFLKIPPQTQHELINTGTENLEFVYFGIAVD